MIASVPAVESALIRAFLAEHIAQQQSKNTILAYHCDLRKLLASVGGTDDGLLAVTHDSLVALYVQAAEKYKPQTMLRLRWTIYAFYRWLVQRGTLIVNPASYIHRPMPPKYTPSFLEEQEVERILAEAARLENPRHLALIETLYACGLRISEALTLDMTDISTETKTVHIRQAKGRKDRVVPIGSKALEALRRYYPWRIDHLALAGVSHEAVFVNQHGKRLGRQGARHSIRRIALEVGIKKRVYPHIFRHTFATVLLNHGADLRDVQALLGHSSLASTMRYLHTTILRQRETYQKCHPRA